MCNKAGVVPQTVDLATLSDREVLRAVASWAKAERRVTAELLRHLGELDARRLYLGAGCSSTFAYCTEILRMSEPAAYHRITAARAGRRFPELLARLAAGDLHLSAICLLASELTEGNVASWIARASGQSKRAVERMLVGERQGPAVAPAMRDAGAGAPSGHTALAEARPGLVSVASVGRPAGRGPMLNDGATASSASACAEGPEAAPVPERGVIPAGARGCASAAFSLPKLSFVADPELQNLLARARDLVSHSNPSGDLAVLLRLALRALIGSTERRRFGQRVAARVTQQVSAEAQEQARGRAGARPAAQAGLGVPLEPGSSVPPAAGSNASPQTGEAHARPALRRRAPRWRSRYIPIAVRRAVWQRDGDRCAFVSREGHRCGARGFLQFHHLIPFAQGGAHTVENLALRCGAHNRYEERGDVGSAGRSAGEDIRSTIVAPALAPESERVADLVRAPEPWCTAVGGSADIPNSPRGECARGAVVAGGGVTDTGGDTNEPDREGVPSRPRPADVPSANARAVKGEVAPRSRVAAPA
ncbi:MAG: HNH endonuclease [Candidatus Eisenbacteria bacterium]|nr:HNH endonuclease [Candidatus Eisenbacteria bacterium]